MDELTDKLKEKARVFVLDNFSEPQRSDFLMIESAMMVGALAALGKEAPVEASSEPRKPIEFVMAHCDKHNEDYPAYDCCASCFREACRK